MEAECTICLVDFNKSDTLVSTKCGHIFHNACLTNWIARSQICPQCRQYCDPASMYKIYIKFSVSKQVDLLKKAVNDLKFQLNENAVKYSEESRLNKVKLQQVTKDNDDLKNKVANLNKQLSEQDLKLKTAKEQCKTVEKKLREMEKVVQGHQTALSVLRSTVDEKEKTLANFKLQLPEEQIACTLKSEIKTEIK